MFSYCVGKSVRARRRDTSIVFVTGSASAPGYLIVLGGPIEFICREETQKIDRERNDRARHGGLGKGRACSYTRASV